MWFWAQSRLVKFLIGLVLLLACRICSLPASLSEAERDATATVQMETALSAAFEQVAQTLSAQPSLTPSATPVPTDTATPSATPPPSATHTLSPTPTRQASATPVVFNQGNLAGGGGGDGSTGSSSGSGGGGGSTACHPAYPTVCIPPPPPDLNCPDIPFRRFTVLSPDPHNFDGNNDGVGCER